jgi:hypothetical protein
LSVFSPYEDDLFDNQFKPEIENFSESRDIFDYKLEENSDYEKKFTLKTVKKKAAPGPDGINNKVLLRLGENGLIFLLHLFNLSFSFKHIPEEWKVAKITMIEKKARDSHNINNYRPIRLTNSIIKLKEKLIKGRLVNYLEKTTFLLPIKLVSGKIKEPSTIYIILKKNVWKKKVVV